MGHRAYRVRVRSGQKQDGATVLQVIAATPEDAERAVRHQLGADAVVEADAEPLTAERAEAAQLISGKLLLS